MNQKGIVLSGLVYALLVFFLLLLLCLITVMWYRQNTIINLDKVANKIYSDLDVNAPPVITLLGDKIVNITVGSIYSDAGATATDDLNGDLTWKIVVTGTVDTNIAGNYTITYSVSDTSNNVTTAIRLVNVIPTYYAFDYTGATQTFNVPYTGSYKIESWGAQGGTFNSMIGGKGGYTAGNINLTKGTPLYVYVGGMPGNGDAGGYNGGGNLSGGQSGLGRAGGGSSDVRLNPVTKYRYIRDYLNGSTANGGNHWIEIEAFDQLGNNVALNKTVTSDTSLTSGSLITDGNFSSGIDGANGYGWVTSDGNTHYVEVDLGAEYDITAVRIWHYYLDGRTYYQTKTILYNSSRSIANTIFDSAVSGTYVEPSLGKQFTETSLLSRIMVAGGGGGANYRNISLGCGFGQGDGGYGGGLTGGTGITTGHTYNGCTYGWAVGTGGTQTLGGYYISYNPDGSEASRTVTGSFGYGGGTQTAYSTQSGGGGGYYGGGASGHGGAGGGSSFISGYTGCNAINTISNPTGQPNHYSGYVFTNTSMIAGNVSMPNTSGGTETGHAGNGYVKITYIP